MASPMKPDSLTAEEFDLWLAWKRAQEVVRARVVEDITAVTGLSDPDFGILFRVDEDGGAMRQNELALSMGWHRSRLSYQLTRMESRGLVERETVDGGVRVVITETGRTILATARPLHTAGVRRHLIELFSDDERRQLHEALRRLGAGP